LITRLSQYPEVLLKAATQHEPHQLVYYLKELANDLHTYYDTDDKRIVIVNEDAALRNARLCLISAVKQVIHNGLSLLGVSAPESM